MMGWQGDRMNVVEVYVFKKLEIKMDRGKNNNYFTLTNI